MTAKALYPLVGQRTAPLLQQSQMEQHYPQHRQGKDVFSTMPNDYGSLQSSDSASRTSGATIKKNTAPIVKLLPPTPSPRLELSGLGGSIDFQFSDQAGKCSKLDIEHGEGSRAEQKALDGSERQDSLLNKAATTASYTSPPLSNATANSNDSGKNSTGETAKPADKPKAVYSITPKLSKREASRAASLILKSTPDRSASRASSTQNVDERPLPPLPPKPPADITSASSDQSDITSTASLGEIDLDAFPKPGHGRKPSALTGPPLTALKRNRLNLGNTGDQPPQTERTNSEPEQIRPRTSSLLPEAQRQIKHTRSKTETKPFAAPVPEMGNKTSRVASGVGAENGSVPNLPKAVFKRKPVQADQAKNLNSTSPPSYTTEADTNKALPTPATPSVISVQTSLTKLKTASDEGGNGAGSAITTDMLTDAFPSPPKSRSSPDSTPQLLPPPSPVPEDSPSKYGLLTASKEDNIENERKDDEGKVNMHIRGKSSTGFDIFRAAAAMTSSTRLNGLVGKGSHFGLPANPRSRLDSIPQGLPSNPKGLKSSGGQKEEFRPGPPLQLIDTNAKDSSRLTSLPTSATDSEQSSSSQPSSATSSNNTFSSSTSTATCSTLVSPATANANDKIPANAKHSSQAAQAQQPINNPPPPPQHIAPLQKTHLNCYQSHARFHLSRNAAAPMPCMACYADNTEDRWTCVWCAIRICAGCKTKLDRTAGHKTAIALAGLPGMQRAVAMGLLGGKWDWRV